MNAEEIFDYFVKQLELDDPTDMGLTLMHLVEFPSGDKRMLTYLEDYINDYRITRITIKPYYYAEIRYAAGAALAAERAMQGIQETVVIPDTVRPLNSGTMRDLALKNNLDFNLNSIKLLPLLREKNLVEKQDKLFVPRKSRRRL